MATAYAQRIAPRYRPIAQLVADAVPDELVAAARVVVEVASGTGLLTGLVQPRTAPGSRYLVLDLSASMLAVGRSGDAAGVAAACADAGALPLRDGSADLIVSSLGPLQEDVGYLVESGRVLRPGGRLVISLWGNDYSEFALMQVARKRLGLGEFPTGRVEAALARFAEAGLVDVSATTTALEVRHDSVRDYLAYRASFGRPAWLPDERRDAWSSALEAELGPYVDDAGGVCLDWTIVVVAARRPGDPGPA